MPATLVEPLDVTTSTVPSQPSSARAEASRANGRRSNGPTSPEGKERSRRNGCKEGLTGKGVVLPPDAAAEVERREAEFARDFQPRNAVERELVRQMALGSWRSGVLAIRIVEHDARVNAARFANWEEDEQIAAVELGHRLGEDPEAAVAQLKRTSAGCDWLIGRWRLLGNGLSAAEDGGPDCTVDRRRPGAGPGPARPAEGAAPPGRVAGLAGVAPRRGPVGLGGRRGRAAGDPRRRRSPSWRRGMRRSGRGSRSPGCATGRRGWRSTWGPRGRGCGAMRRRPIGSSARPGGSWSSSGRSAASP